MAINEQVVTGRKFRKCIDVVNKVWQRISFWTKACDVEFDDGKTAEEKLGMIDGITSDYNCEDEKMAINANALREANQTINQEINTKFNTINSKLGTQCTFRLSGTTLTITSK